MFKRFWILAAVLLAGCMLAGGTALAQEEWNAGKTEAIQQHYSMLKVNHR